MKNFEFIFDPAKRLNPAHEPLWKDRVDRWYQLDETSFALCEAIFTWSEDSLPAFDELVFIVEGTSNLADAEFVATHPPSPAKFVYTLANIAPSVVSQFLKWSGPVYCFCQDFQDENTKQLVFKMAQAKALRDSVKTFILQASPRLNQSGYRVVNGCFIS